MLNNRWFVLVLAAAAVLLVGLRVVKPILDNADEEIVIPDDPDYYAVDIDSDLTGTGIDTALQGAQFDSAQRAIRSIDVDALHWDERPARDPYAPAARVAATDRNALDAVVARAIPVSAIRWPTVSAVVDSRQHQFAVIDGVIRRPGDQFNGFRLAAIETRTARIQHAASRQVKQVKVDAR